jgi:hypothetical protein
LSPRYICPLTGISAWLISHQPAVLFSHNKSAITNQPTVLFSQNKPAPAISNQPNEQAGQWYWALEVLGSYDMLF